MVLVAAHEEQIGPRQHRHRHAGVGDALGDALELGRLEHRHLGHVADRYAAAVAELLGALAHVLDGHALRRIAEVQVHVDIDVELERHLEEAVDLAGRIGIGVGRAAHHPCSRPSGPRS